MDRAEAIRKVFEPDAGYDFEHAFVDSLVALGLLKLDEPPQPLNPEKLLMQQLVHRGFTERYVSIVRQALNYADLKVVARFPQDTSHD